ncbi:DUF5082 family protein [Camelliibacillus cellulosilyticus]|uniref:DUF5082 family protein n=1 Tax=Camelliibacillus cellulosilyticus TaxID=2174486 RepID=A0ABV9GST0_9BACL
MADQLETLRRDYHNKESQLASHHQHIAMLNEKIARIEAIKKDFADFKSDMKEFRSKVSQIAQKDYDDWQGVLIQEYRTKIYDDLVFTALNTYIDKIDDNLDRLNDELMRLQNEIYSTEGIIGHIKEGLNWLKTKIENLLN